MPAPGHLPVQFRIVVPFMRLGEFLAHEQQLLARVPPHEAVIGPQVGETLPIRAGHPAQHRALAMDHLVVADRQDEIFGKSVVQPEGHLVVMVPPVDRVLLHVFERVVHPAHVPLVGETETALVDRARHARPGRRFLGIARGAVQVQLGVEAAQEGDGLEILIAAEFVRHPLAFFARVIQIQHRRDGIDAQQASGTTLISELRSALSEHNQQFQTSAAGLLDGQKSGIDTLVATVREELVALRDAEAGRSEAASERLAQLEGTVSEHLGRLGTALEAPMTRLIETASETPKAAAEVITRLREEMTHSSERDNELLEERRRIMAELDTLLSGQRDAAGAQREAIETLITAASDTLTQVSDTFAQQVSAQSEQLDQVAGDVSGSAAEVASLSDAFATAVQVFSEANDKLLDNLQQVESRLEQSSARADEQLNYYVEQAREVIELSMASQKEVIDALGTLNGAGKNVAQSEERPASEVN